MAKKISIEQLKPGMYVSDLGSDWMSHPFLRSAFAVKDEAMVKKIASSGIHEVYIDPSRGDDVADAPSAEEVTEHLEHEMLRAAVEPVPERKIPASEELVRAKKIHGEANRIIHNIMQDVRLGQQVKLEQAEPVVMQMTESILRNGGALLSLTRVKNKDDYTFMHSVSVCALLVSFCRAMDMDAGIIHLAGIGGLLHDIGKVKVPDKILNKPGRLSDEEFKVMKCHVVESKKILSETDGIAETSIQVAAQHHERHDGSGYPEGLKGEAITQMGQMAAICDVYDAITSERCYHKGLVPHEALRKIFEWSKFHFNPTLVQAFLRTIGIYPVGTLVLLESGRIGVVVEQSESNLLQPVVKVFYDSGKQRYLPTLEVDLAKPLGHGGGDRIVSHESPEKWGIDPLKFL
ncbi:cyclic di-GMP phosphodiesterase response regulator RpfG [mine drainage metagenome]|uniref:Cyclic di-GMP phosphodiesterase response regulator RpfG n=1 Tax=mine drainage metagenome TaxID=410659 RepID=A0A1J5SYP1_9ZZZZ